MARAEWRHHWRVATDSGNREQVEGSRLAVVGRLTRGAAHEINNPLFVMLGLVELVLRDAEPGSRTAERLRLVQESGEEIRDIVRAMLDFARTQAGADAAPPEQVADAVRAALELVRRTKLAKDVDLVERYAEGAGSVDVVAADARLLLVDLLLDAVAAVRPPGAVEVAVDGEVVRIAPGEADGGAGLGERSRALAAAQGAELVREGDGATVLRFGA